MKILLINNVHYNRGGADKVYLNTGNLLTKKGHDISYFSIMDKNNYNTKYSRYFIDSPNFKNKGFFSKLLTFPRYYFSRQAQIKLQFLIDQEKPEIAHIHLLYGGGLTSSILPILNKNNVKIVLTIHDYKLLCPVLDLTDNNLNICEKCCSGNYMPCILKRCKQKTFDQNIQLFNSIIFATESWFRDWIFNYDSYISKYIFVSEFSRKIHQRNKPFFNGKSEVIFNFIDFDQNEKNFPILGKYYLFFGRLSKEKGIMTLLEAFKNRQDCHLIIIGEGALKNEIQDFIKVNVLKNVDLLDYMTGNELDSYIKNSKFVIVPSEWYENNPLSIIESFRFGKPVLGANIGGIPELVKVDKTGFLFQPKSVNSLMETIEKVEKIDVSRYNTLSDNAVKFASDHFNSDAHYLNLMNIYNDLLKH